MDAQMKKGFLDVCVLAALSRGESYGYKIIDDLKGFIEVSESTLYPILKRLEQGGQLSVDSREHNGRLRKYYNITPSGTTKLKDFKNSFLDMQKVFNFIFHQEEK